MGVLSTVINQNNKPATKVGAVVQALTDRVAGNGLLPDTLGNVVATESISDVERQELQNVAASLAATVESIAVDENLGDLTPAQRNAAVGAGVLATNPVAYLSKPIPKAVGGGDVVVTEATHIMDAYDQHNIAIEAYDERENKNATVYSIAYNLQAARQDEFGETFFPTITVAPDEAGMAIVVRQMTVMSNVYRKVKGDAAKFNKRPLLRAFADYTVLRDDVVTAVPVYRAGQNDDKFVDTSVIPPRSVEVNGVAVQTAPLAIDKRVDILGLSQTDELLAAGVMDNTDALDPTITLKSLYIKVVNGSDTDILKLDVAGLPKSNFTYSTQGQSREMILTFDSDSIVLGPNTKAVDGSALTALAALAQQGLSVRIRVVAHGDANLEYGNIVVYGNSVEVSIIRNASGEIVPLNDSSVADLVKAINDAEFLGYEVEAFRSNSNIRSRGQLVDYNEFVNLISVPVRSPINAVRPVNNSSSADAADLASLVTATRIRTSNSAVTTLLDTAATLAQYVNVADEIGEAPEVLGVGRYFVKPVYFQETIDVANITDSLTSTQRVQDIQSALINKVREYAYRMYSESEYKAAADALNGGMSEMPTIIVGTDPRTSRYLTATDIFKNIGGGFKIKVVSTLDRRVEGKIFITFGVFDGNENTTPNPLSFGNMAWSPEVTLVLPVTRNGQTSKELMVAPRYRHVVHLPVMTVLTVQGLPDALDKLPVYTQTV